MDGTAIMFKPLPIGYTEIGHDELICEGGCGETYLQRCIITPDGLCYTERIACSCLRAILQSNQQDWAIDKAKTKRANQTYQIGNYFNGFDLSEDQAYFHATFATYKPDSLSQREALTRLKAFEVGTQSVCLYGGPGRGKTHLALSIAKQAKADGKSVLAIKAIDLLTRLKRTYDRRDDVAEVEIMRLLKEVDVLVIDDIGTEKSTEWVRSKFYEIIDYRMNRKTTIFTTNLSSGETERKEGGALVSRIWGSDLCLCIEGYDYRLRRVK